MKNPTDKWRRKYTKSLLASALDLPVRSSIACRRPVAGFKSLWLLKCICFVELTLLRFFSCLIGIDQEFMTMYRLAKNSVRNVV